MRASLRGKGFSLAGRLAGFWFLYLAGLGIFLPYFSLYLGKVAGLSESRVGLVLAVLPLVGLMAQPLWGQVADRSGRRHQVLAVLALGAGAGFLLVGRARGFPALAAATALLAVFSRAVLPTATAVTLGAAGAGGVHGFGRIRVWGTVGFLAAVVLFPRGLAALETGPPGAAPSRLAAMFPAIAACALAAAGVALVLPSGARGARPAGHGEWRRLLRHPPALRLLALTAASQLFSQAPIQLFPLYVDARGGDLGTVSRMWIAMLVLEIPLLTFLGGALRRIGARGIVQLGLLAEGVRWTTCGLGVPMGWLFAAQMLHGLSVAGIILGVRLYLEEASPPSLRSTGQALVSMAGVGVGALVSNAVGGWMFESLGPFAPYLAGGSGSLLLAAFLRGILPAPYRPAEEESPDGSSTGQQQARWRSP